MPFHQHIWTTLSFLLKRVSLNAWQSISILTRNPQIVSENLSKVNLRVANSSRNGLYLASVENVYLDTNAIGWSLCVTVPSAFVHGNLCTSTPINTFLYLSIVITNSVPSHLGLQSTSFNIIVILRSRKAFVWFLLHLCLRLCISITLLYNDFVYGCYRNMM
jgi:hypothetical protein